MILATDKVRVIPQFDELGQRAVWRRARNHKPFFAHLVAIFHVELVTVPVAFEHLVTAINCLRQCACCNFRRPRAEPHACAFVAHAVLFFEQ
jgi:hypothetical protein